MNKEIDPLPDLITLKHYLQPHQNRIPYNHFPTMKLSLNTMTKALKEDTTAYFKLEGQLKQEIFTKDTAHNNDNIPAEEPDND